MSEEEMGISNWVESEANRKADMRRDTQHPINKSLLTEAELNDIEEARGLVAKISVEHLACDVQNSEDPISKSESKRKAIQRGPCPHCGHPLEAGQCPDCQRAAIVERGIPEARGVIQNSTHGVKNAIGKPVWSELHISNVVPPAKTKWIGGKVVILPIKSFADLETARDRYKVEAKWLKLEIDAVDHNTKERITTLEAALRELTKAATVKVVEGGIKFICPPAFETAVRAAWNALTQTEDPNTEEIDND